MLRKYVMDEEFINKGMKDGTTLLALDQNGDIVASRQVLYIVFVFLVTYLLGIKVQNLKIDFNTGGTWRQVKQ